MIDLRRLRVLRAVAYYGTVTAAAESLRLTPSAASQQVRQLARDLGVDLLEPQGRRVRLTSAAHRLLAHADAIEARWEQAEADLQGRGAQPSGALTVCGIPTAVSTLLAPLAATLRAKFSALTVKVVEAMEPSECYDLVFNGDVDLAVLESVPGTSVSDRQFDQRPVLDDPFDLLVNTGHRLAHRPAIPLADVADEAWITGRPGSSCERHVSAACSAAGFSPNVAHEAREWAVIASLVAHDLGVALVPRLAQLSRSLPVVRVPLTGTPQAARTFISCTRQGGRDAPAVAAALKELEALVEAPSRRSAGSDAPAATPR